MQDHEYRSLIAKAVAGGGPCWADLGSGDGGFTLALAQLLGDQARIVSVDTRRSALAAQRKRFAASPLRAAIDYLQADFTAPLSLPELDGLLLANALHFCADPAAQIGALTGHLRSGGRLVLVEYDIERGNPWVPYPISRRRWPSLAAAAGLTGTRIVAAAPSRYHQAFYTAVSYKP